MVLMAVYGRLSDGLGKRRLILIGIVIFSLGTTFTLFAPDLNWLMIGRVIQGIGAAGMMPLAMAFISTIFPARERGKALGTWSTIGPGTAFVSPLIAGFLIDLWGWRVAFAPPLLVGLLTLVVVWRVVPAGLSVIKRGFLRRFDWIGVILLTAAVTFLLFYLSSRPITGVESLRDWRLLIATIIFVVSFLVWEKRTADSFVDLTIFRNRTFSLATVAGMMRMFTMAGVAFLLPLYLADVYQVNAATIGGMMMISPGAMALMVRFGGQAADRWGSRWPVSIGLLVQMSVMLMLSQLPVTTPFWVLAIILAYHGLGAGFVLAALHRAALGGISEAQMGAAAGIYSMIRFAGVVIGTALAGVILQHYFDLAVPLIDAYQVVFLVFGGFALAGVLIGLNLHEPPQLRSASQAQS
jgi:EmrB/QacA subfamily drug resistance transporter